MGFYIKVDNGIRIVLSSIIRAAEVANSLANHGHLVSAIKRVEKDFRREESEIQNSEELLKKISKN